MNPPKNIDPEILYATLASPTRAYNIINYPKKNKDGNYNIQLAITVLTRKELLSISKRAKDYCKNIMKSKSFEDLEFYDKMQKTIENNRYSTELIYECCRNVKNIEQRFFPNIDVINKVISDENVNYFYKEFSKVQNSFNPISLNTKQFEKWQEVLISGGKGFLEFYILGSTENTNDAFNKSVSEMTEGQLLCWYAARKFYKDQNNNQES